MVKQFQNDHIKQTKEVQLQAQTENKAGRLVFKMFSFPCSKTQNKIKQQAPVC